MGNVRLEKQLFILIVDEATEYDTDQRRCSLTLAGI